MDGMWDMQVESWMINGVDTIFLLLTQMIFYYMKLNIKEILNMFGNLDQIIVKYMLCL